MRRAVEVLLVLALLAVSFTLVGPSSAHADDTLVLPTIAIVSVDSPDSLLTLGSEPARWGWGGWGWGWGGWPWWAGRPLWQISAMTGFTWPWWSGPVWGGWPAGGGWGGWPSWGGISGMGGMPGMGGMSGMGGSMGPSAGSVPTQ